MSNDLIPPDDRAPDLYIDREGQAYSRPEPKPDNLDPRHRKMIRGFGWLAWLVVLGLTGYMLFNSFMVQKQRKDTVMARGELLQPVFLGKFALGMRELARNPGGAQLESQAADFVKTLNAGPVEQRFCHAIIVNEFDGPEKALAALTSLKSKTSAINLDYNQKQTRLEKILISVFGSVQKKTAPVLAEDDREYLLEHLPWFGELALNNSESDSSERAEFVGRAEFSVILVSLGVIVGLCMLVVGAITFFIFATKVLNGSLRHRVVDNSRYGPVYVETFAIWFLMFLGISLALALSGNTDLNASTAAITMLLPMSALIWPVIRGVPNADLLDDVGLRVKNPFVEIAAGFVAYLAMMPLVLAGMICSIILLGIMSMVQTPGGNEYSPTGVPHPIANEAFGGDIIQVMFTIFFIASVLAPLTEEIMFRGVLYRHMRDSSSRMARWASIIFAALFSSIIFAAIHPQGIVGIPVLTTLAFGFCLVRQWRGSLIAPMTMHAIHNGLATSFLIPLLI